MAEILLREMLGQRVVMRAYSNPPGETSYQAAAYRRIAQGEVSINLEMWPRSLPRERAAQLMHEAEVTASQRGPLGYEGRSGWFIPTASLESVRWTRVLGDLAFRALTYFHQPAVIGCSSGFVFVW